MPYVSPNIQELFGLHPQDVPVTRQRYEG